MIAVIVGAVGGLILLVVAVVVYVRLRKDTRTKKKNVSGSPSKTRLVSRFENPAYSTSSQVMSNPLYEGGDRMLPPPAGILNNPAYESLDSDEEPMYDSLGERPPKVPSGQSKKKQNRKSSPHGGDMYFDPHSEVCEAMYMDTSVAGNSVGWSGKKTDKDANLYMDAGGIMPFEESTYMETDGARGASKKKAKIGQTESAYMDVGRPESLARNEGLYMDASSLATSHDHDATYMETNGAVRGVVRGKGGQGQDTYMDALSSGTGKRTEETYMDAFASGKRKEETYGFSEPSYMQTNGAASIIRIEEVEYMESTPNHADESYMELGLDD